MESAAANFARRTGSDSRRGGDRFMNPVATPFFFYMLAGLAVISGVLVITRRNAVYSPLALIVTLLSLAGLFFLFFSPLLPCLPVLRFRWRVLGVFLVVALV